MIYGDWGLGIGDWGLGIGPNPQSPIDLFSDLFYNLLNYPFRNIYLDKFLNKIK